MPSALYPLVVSLLIVVCVAEAKLTTRLGGPQAANAINGRNPTCQRMVHKLSEECQNGEYCSGGEECCNKGSFCCSSDTTCCQDTCCQKSNTSKAETCCPDPKNGGVCCLQEDTFCCPPNPALDHPSRCCPRWMVCCQVGRYGCCDPDTMLPMEATQATILMEETSIWEAVTLNSLMTDIKNGTYTSTKVIPGTFHTEGEITRSFMFDPASGDFLILQANFTAPPPKRDERRIKLYRITPASGKVVALNVTGAYDEVTGFKYVAEKKTIIMATYWYNLTDGGRKGYQFYRVDPTTAAATLVSQIRNPTNGPDTFCGWFHEVSPDLTMVYRLGYQNVIESVNFGIGQTNISTMDAKMELWVALAAPADHKHFRSLHFYGAHPDAQQLLDRAPSFLSLAASMNYTNPGDLSLFEWSLAAPTAVPKLRARWKNAHTSPYFGPINECLNKDRTKYAAIVSAASPLGNTYDAWTIASVDLSAPSMTNASLQVPLKPLLLSSTDSVSGFGIPYEATWFHN